MTEEVIREELNNLHAFFQNFLISGSLTEQEFGELYYILSTMETMCFYPGNNTSSSSFNLFEFKKWLEELIEARKQNIAHNYDIERMELYLKICYMVLGKLNIILRVEPSLAAPKRFMVVYCD